MAREEGEKRKSTKRKERRMGYGRLREREMWMHWGPGGVTCMLLEGCAEKRETEREREVRRGGQEGEGRLMTTPVPSPLTPIPEP